MSEAGGDGTPVSATKNWVQGDGLEPGDAYMEGEYLVFTGQFHTRRGYCCNSDCRHCPFRDEGAAEPA